MRVEPEKISKYLNGDYRTGHCLWIPYTGCVKSFQRLPSTTTEIRKRLAVVKKIPLQNFRYAQHHMPMRYGLHHLLTKLLTELHLTLLMAGWTKMTPFA